LLYGDRRVAITIHVIRLDVRLTGSTLSGSAEAEFRLVQLGVESPEDMGFIVAAG
jgi:hypothetical protein